MCTEEISSEGTSAWILINGLVCLGAGLAGEARGGVLAKERGYRPEPAEGAALPEEPRDLRGSCPGTSSFLILVLGYNYNLPKLYRTVQYLQIFILVVSCS